MPAVQKPALRDLATRLLADPNARVDGGVLDMIVAIVGDKHGFALFGGVTTEKLAKQLRTANLSLESKLDIARAGLDSSEKSDLLALLGDAQFSARLDPVGLNFLRAIVGLEALKNIDRVELAVVKADPSAPHVKAADKMREIMKSGKLKSYYDAVIGAVDNPALKADAEALFNALPEVRPGMSPDDFVKAGLWRTAPRGVAEMQKSARYLPGRQLLVETTLVSKVPKRPAYDAPAAEKAAYEAARLKIGEFDPHGVTGVTYRATLVGEDPQNRSNFLVKVDGAAKPISVSKESIYRHNQPHDLADDHIRGAHNRQLPYNGESWHIDYSSMLAKAKLCEIALGMEELVAKLDFTKTKTAAADGLLAVFGRGDAAKKMVDVQKDCVKLIFESIDMEYPQKSGLPFNHPGRAPQGTRDAARQAIRGTGMCVQQSSVFGALLMPFMEVLGVDGQYRSGNCFRNIRNATDNVYAPDFETGHGWWQITFRPSMEMTVTDRTWDHVNLALDLAYGFPYGDRYATRNITGYKPRAPSLTDVDVTGRVTVETFERQFSAVGHGRERHISNRHRP